MLRTITSNAARIRQRQRIATRRIINQSSPSALLEGCSDGNHLHNNNSSIGACALQFCMPCTDSNSTDNNHHSCIHTRSLHSLVSTSNIHHHNGYNKNSYKNNAVSLSSSLNTVHMHHPSQSAISSPITTTQRRTKVFVSRHNNTLNLTPQTIVSYITAHLPHLNPNSINNNNSDFRITNSHVILKECPFCSKPTNNKSDNLYKIYIAIGGGAYFCHRCGAKGSWYDFKSEVGGFALDSTNVAGAVNSNHSHGGGGYNAPIGGARQVWDQTMGNIAGNLGGAGGMNGGGGGGGGVSQPWNWNTSNNQGMSYVSTKQLNGTGQHKLNGHSHNNSKQKVDLLPMPPKKLNSIYTTKLFHPNNSPTTNSKEYAAYEYLTNTRGLNKNVLMKYGVGCASYNFPSKDASNGISYVPSMCVTFPWLMRANEVSEQEELRGAMFVWKAETDDDSKENVVKRGSTENTNGGEAGKNKDESNSRGMISTPRDDTKPKKKQSEMSALERYHYRRERKDRAKALKEEKAAARKKQLQEAVSNGMLADELHALPSTQQQQEELEQQQITSEEEAESLYGPYISRRIKVRSIEQKSWQRLDPPGGGFGLFGWHTVPHNATELIITEGEFDAMAVYQATGRAAVSLPNGCRSLPMEVLVLLERFDTIYLWMDNDGPGREGAEMFARKLGVERCLMVQPSGKRGWKSCEDEEGDSSDDTRPAVPPKDANEALLTGWDINELMEEAREMPHERILQFSDLRDQVIHEIVNPEKYRGAAIPSLPGFTSLIKGFRRGEMTVLTGPTG